MQENEKEQLEGDEENETVTSKVLSALGILNTLGTLILSVETKPELLRALEDSIQPILSFVLDNGVFGIYLVTFRSNGQIFSARCLRLSIAARSLLESSRLQCGPYSRKYIKLS